MRIAIAGAGNVGRAIARELLDNGHQVLLIDKDPKALKLESVPDAEWLMADACEITSLDNAHLDNCQVLVAATNTWQLLRWALSRDVISHASAISHSASGTLSNFRALGSLSIKRT